ncbi:hypothetical protein AVEN_145455-1 [Araneus ventricosus]|uniref:Uncharacterized protein n=1 Tax=Araneus ventricosus TaxID=182803 RepID=A0A4Y2MVC3_ARAVE|nr:hypothetical protein AVEN_145455-1 [Araneus ventricosus]
MISRLFMIAMLGYGERFMLFQARSDHSLSGEESEQVGGMYEIRGVVTSPPSKVFIQLMVRTNWRILYAVPVRNGLIKLPAARVNLYILKKYLVYLRIMVKGKKLGV